MSAEQRDVSKQHASELGQLGALALALARWGEAAKRLALSSQAAACGAQLLAAEIDLDAATRLMGGEAAKSAPRRTDLVRVLSEGHGAQAALEGLVELESRRIIEPIAGYAGPWLLAEVELSRSVRNHCLGVKSDTRESDVAYRHTLRLAQSIERIAERCKGDTERYLVAIRGTRGCGRDTLLDAVAQRLDASVMVKSVLDLRQPVDQLEPELSDAVPAWDCRRADPGPDDYEAARRWLKRGKNVAFAILDSHQDVPDVEGRLNLVIDAAPSDYAERRESWVIALQAAGVETDRVDAVAPKLAARNQAGIGLAAQTALLTAAGNVGHDELLAALEGNLSNFVQPSTLRGICVEHPDTALSRVIAAEQVAVMLQRLLLLCSAYAACPAPGRHGVKALFCGGSGTGKTLAARALASEVGRPLYRIDLATVVSKWIGETEKNLRDAMVAAAAVGAVLLFDEGDALFGKRGEVSKGSDRYANMEVSYLLQAIEEYDGIAVVTTNLRGNVDKAFERRFDTCIEFPPPEVEQRLRIWQQELGNSASELELSFVRRLAQRAELNGGNIATAARLARVLAFERGETHVNPADLQCAVQAEFLKLGSTVRAHNWTHAIGSAKAG